MSKPIRIVRDNERLVHEIGESKFYYKRVKGEQANKIRKEHTNRGELDAVALSFYVLDNYLLGWDNIQDWENKQVPFNKENIRDLPDEILAELLGKINSSDGNIAEKEKAEKNS